MPIVDLDSQNAATIFSSIRVVRDRPTKALTPVDLENYTSQAAWKFFDKCRRLAAERFGVGEMDVLMTDARVVGIRMDGHKVINPSGFTGRELEVILSVSVVRKDTADEPGTFVEGASVRAHILSDLEKLSRGFYIEIGDRHTTMISIEGDDVAYLNHFDWGRQDVVADLVGSLDLSEEIVSEIYKKHTVGHLSNRLSSRIDKVFFKTFTAFMNAAAMNIRNTGAAKLREFPPVYLEAHFPLPSSLYRKRFGVGTKQFKFLQPPSSLNIEDFLSDEAQGVYQDLNELAKRRIRWLTPTS